MRHIFTKFDSLNLGYIKEVNENLIFFEGLDGISYNTEILILSLGVKAIVIKLGSTMKCALIRDNYKAVKVGMLLTMQNSFVTPVQEEFTPKCLGKII